MRVYFHLLKGEETIRDDRGIEVADIEDARTQALEAIAEMLARDPRLAGEAAGWTLAVTDAAGAVLFTLPVNKWLAN